MPLLAVIGVDGVAFASRAWALLDESIGMNDCTMVSGLSALSSIARDIAGEGLEPLVARAGQADFVLLGEATHGTREFYELRAAITRRLVIEHGFTIIALEADWPDALRLHHYVSGSPGDHDAIAALGDFERFPRWMWRNEVMLPFLDALREWNRPLAEGRVGIFGMDLYSLHASIRAVLDFLRRKDRSAERRARERYGCFDHFGPDPQRYGYFTERAGVADCEREVIAQLVEMRKRYAKQMETSGDDHFFALQHARVVADAESYYRAMYRGRDESWNLRRVTIITRGGLRRWWCGRTIHTSAMRVRRRWAPVASGTWGNCSAKPRRAMFTRSAFPPSPAR